MVDFDGILCDPQERYEIESDENRLEVAQNIYRTYLDREVSRLQGFVCWFVG
jgi:hypothetical protein